MSGVIEPVVKVTDEGRAREDQPRVEVIDGPLCSASELHRAVVSGAIASGILGAIAGIGIGFWLGLREGER